MNPVTVLWSLAAGAALTLGLVHVLVWLRDRAARGNLMFAVVAVSYAGMAAVELELMAATTPQEYASWLRWFQAPIFGAECALVLFVRSYFGTATEWLGWIVIALRTVILAVTLGLGVNFNFEEIAGLVQVSLLGESVSEIGEATVGRWQWVATTCVALLLIYVLDATIRLWRHGDRDARRKAWLIGGTIVVFYTLSSVPRQMVIWGAAHLPILVSPPFLILVLAMGLELSREVLKATRLSRDLRDRDDQLELAANAGGVGIWAWNAATRLVHATDRARSLLGIEKEGSIDIDTWCAAIHPDDVGTVRTRLDEALASGKEFSMEFRVRASAAVRWIAARGRLDSHYGGASTVIRGIVREVTERKRAVDEARELRRDLTHAGRVTLLGQLSAALAHELSQPLGAILRNAEAAQMMLQGSDPDLAELREILADIQTDDQRAANVINHLRALLRRGSMDIQPLQLESVVRDVVALARGDAAGKHVALDFVALSPLPPVLGDRVHLSQVLLNLIMNGVDAVQEAKHASPRVAIDAKCLNGMIEVAVSDSGNGIAPGAIDRVFDPFFTTKTKGMGMGLPVSRTIVEAHGGKIWAENNDGSGATFRFTVPAVG